MSERYFKGSVYFPRFTVLLLLLLVLPGAGNARDESEEGSALSKLKVVEHLKGYDGGYSDMFVKLKKHRDFQRLSRKHGIDDPAVWPTLRKRIALKLADLQGEFSQAESMMAAKDRQGGLNNKVVSAEKTREKGRRLHARLVWQMDELRQMLRLIDEMESVLENVSREHALTDEINIENKAGKSFPGQVLLIDGKDLIVKRGEVGYFRIPARLLSTDMKLEVINKVASPWQALPDRAPAFVSEGTVELVAFDDSRLYIKSSLEGLVTLTWPEDESILVSYAAELEAVREALAESEREEKEALQAEVSDLEAALRLNQSRANEIQWYASRLGVNVPVSDEVALKVALEEDESPSAEIGVDPGAEPKSDLPEDEVENKTADELVIEVE